MERLRAQHKIMLDRAVEHGDNPAQTGYEVVLDLPFGAAPTGCCTVSSR